MPDLISKNKIPLKVGDIVALNLTVAQVFPAVDAMEVARDAQPVDGVTAASPWNRYVRFGASRKDAKNPI